MASMNWFEKLWVNGRLWDSFTLWYCKILLSHITQKPSRILEIGCGKGTTTLALARAFPKAKITAVDIDSKQIELAKNRKISELKRVTFTKKNATRLGQKSNVFDAVFEFNALHHISQWKKVIREAKRILMNGGKFYVFDVGHWFTRTLHTLFLSKELAHLSKKDLKNNIISEGFLIERSGGNDCFFFIEAKIKKNRKKIM